MNIERLKEVITAINYDLQTTNLIKNIEKLITAIDQVMQSPQPAHEKQLVDTKTLVIEAIDSSRMDDLSRTWRPYIRDLGIEELLGSRLKSRIEEVFARNQITRANVSSEIKAMRDELIKYRDAFQQLLKGMSVLNLSAHHADPSLVEVSILFPKKEFAGTLGGFGEDVKFFAEVIGLFSEVATGTREEPELLQLSNPDPLIIAAVTGPTALAILIFVDKALNVGTSVYKLRKARAEALEAEAKKEIITQFDAQIEEKIISKVEEMARQLIETAEVDEPRKNELLGGYQKKLIALTHKIDNGYEMDANPVEPEENGGAEEGEAQAEAKPTLDEETIASIKSLSRQIHFRRDRPDGPTLMIANDDEVADEAGKAGQAPEE